MWCVVADNGDEFWVYGPFPGEAEAQEYADKLDEKERHEISYWKAELLEPEK